ncbi:MAG TPA: GDP-mannose 4,6-dehydratase [Solirubrobacteraceae bacterium]|nr:GDP-mannose 4,6-dehydratase [Solirubrobacteraceae bacterium]
MAEPPRRALVTGLTGQDGSFLAELLLSKGYAVTGVVRGWPHVSLDAGEHLRGQVEAVPGELLDPAGLRATVERVRPHELYHLAAPSFVPDSWERPAETCAAIVDSTAALLEAVREIDPTIRVFLANTGAIFGEAGESPQHEDTRCRPHNPYAIAKLAAHQLAGALRARDGLYVCSGILYNHESERRPPRFVTRKLTRAAAEVELGLAGEVEVGDLGAVRDWSFAGDIVRGAWLMLQQEQPDDFILASGQPHTVAEWARAAFACVGRDADQYLRVAGELVRVPESTPMVGDPTRARKRLGWEVELGFEQLVERMVRADLEALR